MGDGITVYDCQTQKEQIEHATNELQQPGQFNQSVLPWLDGCKEGAQRYHFVYRAKGQIDGWMMVDILTHEPKPGRKWTYAYLDKVSVRNGTNGVGKALGEYLKTWAIDRKDIDFIWLWAINKRVSAVYEASWLYNRVQYYDDYGFMFFPHSPPAAFVDVTERHPRTSSRLLGCSGHGCEDEPTQPRTCRLDSKKPTATKC